MKQISSSDNPTFKQCISLLKPGARKKLGKFLIEGEKEIAYAMKCGFHVQQLILKEGTNPSDLLLNAVNLPLISFSESLFTKLVYRESVVNVLAIAISKFYTLEQIETGRLPLLLILESVEKPGNLGAIIRTADAFDADAVIVCDPKVDFYNPNVLRSSVGTVFHMPLVNASGAEILDYLKANKIPVFSTCDGPATDLHHAKLYSGAAFILGTEATGLSSYWVENGAENIRIPMSGINDSLNVSVAAALLLYEAKRQMGF